MKKKLLDMIKTNNPLTTSSNYRKKLIKLARFPLLILKEVLTGSIQKEVQVTKDYIINTNEPVRIISTKNLWPASNKNVIFDGRVDNIDGFELLIKSEKSEKKQISKTKVDDGNVISMEFELSKNEYAMFTRYNPPCGKISGMKQIGLSIFTDGYPVSTRMILRAEGDDNDYAAEWSDELFSNKDWRIFIVPLKDFICESDNKSINKERLNQIRFEIHHPHDNNHLTLKKLIKNIKISSIWLES